MGWGSKGMDAKGMDEGRRSQSSASAPLLRK